jgi:streptogramin lyase
LNNPAGVDVDDNGRLWIADGGNHRVLGFDDAAAILLANGAAADAVLGQADFTSGQPNRGGAASAATLSSPFGVYADPAGNLWVSEVNTRRVLRYNSVTAKPDGGDADLVLGQAGFTTIAIGIAINTIDQPVHLSEGPDGSILIPDFRGDRVLRFDPVNVGPTITLTGPARRSTKRSSITLSGAGADSDGTLASVKATVNNKAGAVSGTTAWSLRARLKPGRNLITLRSIDNLGLSSGLVTVTVTRR